MPELVKTIQWRGPFEWSYHFYTEDGYQELWYKDYLGTFIETGEPSKLMRMVSDRLNRENLFLGRTIISYDRRWLESHPAEKDMVAQLKLEQEENPLQFYCPNGQGQLAFLNAQGKYSVSGLIQPNRCGKTTTAWIDMLLDLIPCDPKWKIFEDHGVIWRPYNPPKDGWVAAVGSYELVNLMSTIWPQVIKKWTPKKFLGEYAAWGDKDKVISWKNSPRIQNEHLNIWLMYYSMNQTPFESQAVDRFMWDEQGEETKFDGADERLRTRNGRHVFSLTPHKVEGRPDTGAGSWIHDMDVGRKKKGHTVKFFRGSLLDDVPDWIYPEKQKIIAYNKWIVEPEMNNDRKTLKEGQSRLYGMWHETGGLVYDEWDRKIHLCDPFDIPSDWTRYRALDWGRVNPTACLWGAVNPEGDLYIYDMYYKANALVSETAKAIIEKSGNSRKRIDIMRDERSGAVYERFEEVQNTRFYMTVMDSRSYQVKSPMSTLTIGRMFMNEGLVMRPACGEDTYLTVPVVKEWLNPDWSKINPHTGQKGKPRVFVFRTLSEFIHHIEHYVNVDTTRKNRDGTTYKAERPKAVDDHDMDAFRYMIMCNPHYINGFGAIDKVENAVIRQKRCVDSYTGY